MSRGNSVTSGVTHFNFFWEPGGGGCGDSPLCGSYDIMGAVSRREAVPCVQVRAHLEPGPPTRRTWGDENEVETTRGGVHRKKPSDVPKRAERRRQRPGVTTLPQGCVAVRLLLPTLGRPTRVSARANVRDVLRLRAAALDLLGGGQPDWPRCSARTWDVFLRTERCALALKSRLSAPAPGIEEAATRELQRVLSARGQLLRIGQLARAHDIPAIVLKGGAAALTSPAPVDVQDVDVLVPPLQAEQLAELLDREGFSSTGPAGTAHLAQRIAPNTVQIEVHFALNDVELTDAMWERARPLDGVPGLSRFGAADHLWHLLVHSVVTHPYRRGSLRDVLLTAEALRECAPGELREMERRIAAHPLSSHLSGLWAMAREFGDGSPVRDRFRREAAANYVLRGPLAWLGFSRFWTTAFLSALFAQLGGATDRRLEWATAWQRPPFPSPWGFAARLEHRWPTLGRWCRTATKVARLIAARAAAWPVAAVVRYVSGGGGG